MPARARRMSATARPSTRFLAWLDREAAERQAHRDRRGRGARKLPPRHRPAQGCFVPDHRRRRARRRHRALSRHHRDQSPHRARRVVPGRLRRPIRGRHHRHHPHGRGRRADGGDARPLHPRAQGPHRDRARGLSRGHDRRAARFVRAPVPVGGRASTSTTAPATASAAISRCTKARPASPSSAPPRSKRGMILSNEPGYYKTGGFGIRIENLVLVVEGAGGPGRREAAQRVRDAHAGADRPAAGRAGACSRPTRSPGSTAITRASRSDAVAARRRRDPRLARRRNPPARASLNLRAVALLDPAPNDAAEPNRAARRGGCSRC